MRNLSKTLKTDFLIIGAGIIGLTLAYNLKRLFPNKSVIVIDKEKSIGNHASGRNSGVLHAGFYYTSDSLKARFTREGNLTLTEYCEKKGLKINKCGKVVVVTSEEDIEVLYELKRRGEKNGVELYIIDEKELQDLEPNAKTYQLALWSPRTSTVEPLEVLKAIKEDLESLDVKIFFETPYIKKLNSNTILSREFVIEAGKIINAAGLYADKIAKDFGFGEDYVLIPFKGLYLEYLGEEKFLSKNVYPVPNIRNPFLGVHFTIKADGKIKIGPTATPCFWRENYDYLANFRFSEFTEILIWDLLLFLKNNSFRRLAFQEISKYLKANMIKNASKLVKNLPKGRYKWGKPGIRAQLVNRKTLELVQDFVVEGDTNSIHILNSVSPAFTASFPFTKYVIEKYIIGGN